MPHSLGLAATARLLASGGATARDVVAGAIAAIDSSQRSLNAFRLVRREAAIAEAEAADARLAAGERAALLGVPVAVKDDTDVAGADC